MRVLTICGSLKFSEEMKVWAEKLTLEGNCVLSVIYPTQDNYSPQEISTFAESHLQRISLSDAIFVVNKDGYIGDAVKNEIAYAEKLGKEIIYLESQYEE